MQPAHEKIGVVDAQWIRHRVVLSLNDSVCAHCNVYIATYIQSPFVRVPPLNFAKLFVMSGCRGSNVAEMGRSTFGMSFALHITGLL